MRVLGLAALRQEQFSSSLREISGYETQTTFYGDFTIADCFGLDAVRDTYKNAFSSWNDDYEFITELYMVLNWKIHEHYPQDMALAMLYDELWKTLGSWCYENLKGEELNYFYRTID